MVVEQAIIAAGAQGAVLLLDYVQGGGPGGAGSPDDPGLLQLLELCLGGGVLLPVQGPGLAPDWSGLVCLDVMLDSVGCPQGGVPAL